MSEAAVLLEAGDETQASPKRDYYDFGAEETVQPPKLSS